MNKNVMSDLESYFYSNPKFNSRIPSYNDQSDYTTNAPSYYDDLARKNKLMKVLALRIWEYEEEMIRRLEQWDKNLEEFPDDVKKLLEKWLEDGTLDHIINDTIFSWKADKKDLDDLKDRINAHHVNVHDFGAKGDGVHDDTLSIQQAIDYVGEQGGGSVFLEPGRTYRVATRNDSTNSILNMHHNYVKLCSTAEWAVIKADKPARSVIYTENMIRHFGFENIRVNADRVCEFVYKADDWVPFMSVKNCRFENATESAFSAPTYVSTFEKTVFALSKVGLTIERLEGTYSTSCTFNSCYAIENSETGYIMDITYSTLNSLACDFAKVGYIIRGLGVSMNSCGIEGVRKPLIVPTCRGLTINSFYMLQPGEKGGGDPTDYLLHFENAVDVTISGIYNNQGLEYDYLIGLTQRSHGGNNITVTDHSVKRHQIYFIDNFTFKRPIKLLIDDETQIDRLELKSVDELGSFLDDLEGKTVNHIIDIQVTDGIQPNLQAPQRLRNIYGTGQIIIRGNEENRKRVRLYGAYNRLVIENCSPLVRFVNVTLENRLGSKYSQIIQVSNSTVILDNVLFHNPEGNACGSAISAVNNSKVYKINNTLVDGDLYEWEKEHKVHESDDSSEIIHAKSDTVPTGFYGNGDIVYKKTIDETSPLGWICTNSGNPAVFEEITK